MRSQYPAAQSRPQRPDWRVSLTTQERPRRPSSPGVEPRLRELGSQQPRLSPGSEFVEAYRGRPTLGWRPGARLFGIWILSGCRMRRSSPILGSREVRWPTAQQRVVAVSPHRSSHILRPVLVSPRSGPRRGARTLSSAQLGLQIPSEVRRRRAARRGRQDPPRGRWRAYRAPPFGPPLGLRAGAVTTPFWLVISSPLNPRCRHTSVLDPNQVLFLFLLGVSVFETLPLQN